MRRTWGRRVATLAVIPLLLVGLVAAGSFWRGHIEIRGTVSRGDLAGIIRAHRTACSSAGAPAYLKWFPVPLRQYIAAELNPIEIIAVPEDGEAIVVYRGFYNFYYDEKGEHRWGTESRRLSRGTKGWQ